MEPLHEPTSAKREEPQRSVPAMPTDAGHRSTIRTAVIEDGKDGHGEVQKYKQSDADGDDNGHSLEDRGKEYHQTSKKEEYGEVKEYAGSFKCT